MNSKIVESLEASSAKRKNKAKVFKRIAARIALILLLSLSLLVFSALAYDFTGTVVKVSEPNGMTVNVTQPGTYGLQATVEVLLDKPLADLVASREKSCNSRSKGHDILGRTVCEAYLNEINIRNVYTAGKIQLITAMHHAMDDNVRSYYPYFWLPWSMEIMITDQLSVQ